MHKLSPGAAWTRGSIAAVFFMLVASAASAQDVQKLDIDKAVELAMANNLELQSSRIDVAIKKRKVDTAWNVFVPTVDIGGSIIRTNTTSSGIATAAVNPTSGIGDGMYSSAYFYPYDVPQWGLAGSLSATLTLNVALFEGIRNLKLDYEAGNISYEKARTKLELNVRKSFYSILLLKQNIKLMEENLAAAERRVKQAQDNYRAGLAPELTFLQARVTAENLKPSLEELRNGLASSLASFAMNLGLPRGTKLELEDVSEPIFVPLDADKLVETSATDSLEIQSLRQSITVLESTRKLAFYNTYTPSLSLSWNADPTFQGDPWEESWLKEDGWKQSSGMFRATIGFRLNGLLPFSKEALGVTDMDDNIRKLNIALAQTIRGTETEIDSIILKLEKSRTSVDALTLNVELAEKAYKLSEEAYRGGSTDLLDVQNDELELRKAQLEVMKEKFNYHTGLLDLEYAVGVPFGTLSGRKK